MRDKLRRSAPPLLYALGDVSLLDREGLGVVGSRAVSETGAEIARSAASEAVAAGLGVLSGGAKGVDRLAMTAAFDAGGPSAILIVLVFGPGDEAALTCSAGTTP